MLDQAVGGLHDLNDLDLIAPGVTLGYSQITVAPTLKMVSDLCQRTRSMGRLRAPASRKRPIFCLPMQHAIVLAVHDHRHQRAF